MKRTAVMAPAALLLAQPVAGQPLNEDFDCYQPGAAASRLPGWVLWPGGADGVVTRDHAHSGSNSLQLGEVNSDVVRWSQFRDEPVTISIMTYVPSDSVGLEGYIIPLSQYDGTGGPWTTPGVQVEFNSSAGYVGADRGDRTPLIVDRWVELRFRVNLPELLCDLHYDGQLWAASHFWGHLHGGATLDAVDLFIHTLHSGPGMYFDDLVVTPAGVTTPPTCGTLCYADCDGSGEVDFFDFLCFQNLFATGDPRADCDQDGDLTFFDFLCFQNAFAAGCP